MPKFQQFLSVLNVADGVSKLFRMALIAALFVALVFTSIVSCSRGNRVANLEVDVEHLKGELKLCQLQCAKTTKGN